MKLHTTVALLYLVAFSSSVAIADTFSADAKARFLELANFKTDHYPMVENSKGVFIQETKEIDEEYRKNKPPITSKPTHKNTYNQNTFTVRRLPIFHPPTV